jgi:hypothetical protein
LQGFFLAKGIFALCKDKCKEFKNRRNWQGKMTLLKEFARIFVIFCKIVLNCDKFNILDILKCEKIMKVQYAIIEDIGGTLGIIAYGSPHCHDFI